MQYKMFVSDLDGTLLNDNNKISKENIEAIKKLEDRGLKFVIATGRTKYILEDYLELVDYKMPLIWSNGSAVSDIDGSTLYTEEISPEIARKVIDLSREYDVEYMIHTLEGLVGESEEGRRAGLEEYNNSVKEEYRIPLITDPMLYDNLEQHNLLKISLTADTDEELAKVQENMAQNIKEINAAFSGEALLDINATGASKGAAVLKLAEKYNIKPNEIITIGDNENDISMFKASGLPLTLDNAHDSIKGFAKYVTRDNNSNGVADAIERFVL